MGGVRPPALDCTAGALLAAAVLLAPPLCTANPALPCWSCATPRTRCPAIFRRSVLQPECACVPLSTWGCRLRVPSASRARCSLLSHRIRRVVVWTAGATGIRTNANGVDFYVAEGSRMWITLEDRQGNIVEDAVPLATNASVGRRGVNGRNAVSCSHARTPCVIPLSVARPPPSCTRWRRPCKCVAPGVSRATLASSHSGSLPHRPVQAKFDEFSAAGDDRYQAFTDARSAAQSQRQVAIDSMHDSLATLHAVLSGRLSTLDDAVNSQISGLVADQRNREAALSNR